MAVTVRKMVAVNTHYCATVAITAGPSMLAKRVQL